MKRVVAVLVAAVAIGSCSMANAAQSVKVGDMKLTCKVIELIKDTITADGKVTMLSTQTGTLKTGQVRLDSLVAQTVKFDIISNKTTSTPKSAKATGGVTIKARRANQDTDAAGKPIVVMQTIQAVAQNAIMENSMERIVLTGKVTVKITEPGNPNPVYDGVCDKLTLSLKDGKMRMESDSEDQTQINFVLKEKRQ